MSMGVQEFRKKALEALNRMAEIEERLCADAEREGNEVEAILHEHGAMALREAAYAIEGLGGE